MNNFILIKFSSCVLFPFISIEPIGLVHVCFGWRVFTISAVGGSGICVSHAAAGAVMGGKVAMLAMFATSLCQSWYGQQTGDWSALQWPATIKHRF